MEIIVTYGVPGSGKSRWAKEQVAGNSDRIKRVNKDDLRALLHAGEHTSTNEKFIMKIRDTIIEKAIRGGYDIIVDDTNFPIHGFHYDRFCEIARKVGNVTVTEKFFPITLEDALIANLGPFRNPCPEQALKGMFKKYIDPFGMFIPTMTSVYFPKIKMIEYDPDLPDCYLVDLDGTTCHGEGLRSMYDWKSVGKDHLDFNVSYTVKQLAERATIFMVSGRDEVCRPETEEWLRRFDIPYKALFMRPEKDQRKDTIIKREIFDREFKGKYNVIACFDDRQVVVDAYRSMGLKVYQVQEGDF